MIRRNPGLAIFACCAAIAVVVGGTVAVSETGSAAAAPARPTAAAAMAAAAPAASQEWSLNGANSVDVSYAGMSFVYSVTFVQNGSSLTGTLDDEYYPTSGPISGTIDGDSVTFTFDYPSGSIQGTRTYTGTISSSGAVSGTWTQTGDESPDNGTWTLASNAVPLTPSATPTPTASPTPSPSPTCSADYQSVVTQYAGVDAIPELFTDTVTFSWCAGTGYAQIFNSSQDFSLETSGLLLWLQSLVGLSYSVGPDTAPDPTIDNEQSYASTTASGVIFSGNWELGSVLVDLLPDAVLAKAAKLLLPFIRAGRLANIANQVSAIWDSVVSATESLIASNFGLPPWAAKLLAEFGLDKVKDAVISRAAKFAAALIASLPALGRNASLSSIASQVRSAIEDAVSALDFTSVDWAPQLTITVDGSATPSVSTDGSKWALDIDVQDPQVETNPAY